MHTTALWPRCLLLGILLLPALARAQSETVPVVIGGYSTPRPDRLELLLELPPGTPPIQPGDIQLLEDARATVVAKDVKAFRDADWSLSTVLAIDTSRSMAKYLPPVRTALPDFVAALPPGDALALITFDDNVHGNAPFGSPRDQLQAQLQSLKATGRNTVLHDAINSGLMMLEGRPPDRARLRILVVSDGADESSGDPSATDGIIQHAVRSRVAIDTLWLGQPVAAKRNTLVRLAERTGGLHRDAIKANSVDADVKAALNDLAAIAANAIIASFDRRIDTSANTREVGVSLASAGTGAATMALQVPRSATEPPTPQTPVDDGQEKPWEVVLKWTIRLAPVLPAAYGAYFLYYRSEKRKNPHVRLPDPVFWRVKVVQPIPLTTDPVYTSDPVPASRRYTMVAQDRAPGAGGITQGLALEAIDGPLRGQRVAVPGPRFQIGAGNDNDLRITTDKFLSGVHARIEHSQGQWVLIDQGSSNGTIVNGSRLASGQSHPLHDGESIRLGVSEFRVLIAPPAAVAAKPDGTPAEDRPV